MDKTKEEVKEWLLEKLNDPSVRVFEAKVYVERVDEESNVRASTKTVRWEKP